MSINNYINSNIFNIKIQKKMTYIPKKFFHTGNVFLTGSNKILSRAINFFNKSQFSHAFLLVEEYGQFYASEMKGKGLVLTPIEKYLTGKYNICVLKPLQTMTIAQRLILLREVGERSGTRYDFFDILVLQPMRSIGNIFKKDWFPDKYGKKEHRFICSHWVAHLLNLTFAPVKIIEMNESKIAPYEYLECVNLKICGIF